MLVRFPIYACIVSPNCSRHFVLFLLPTYNLHPLLQSMNKFASGFFHALFSCSLTLALMMMTNKIYFKFFNINLPYVTPGNFEILNNGYKLLNIQVNFILLYFAYTYAPALPPGSKNNYRTFPKYLVRNRRFLWLLSVHLRILVFFLTYNFVYTMVVNKYSRQFDLWAAMTYDDVFCVQVVALRMNLNMQVPKQLRFVLVMGLGQDSLVFAYNILVCFIENDTLYVSSKLWVKVFLALYVYINNFFMSTYIITFWRKIFNPSLDVDATYLPISKYALLAPGPSGLSPQPAPA